jgi:Ca2+-binding RTX toxin-like protein
LLLCAASAASGATIVVQSTSDSGPGSLRQAIADSSPGDTIQLPVGTYAVTSAQLVIPRPLTIAGAGARDTIVQADGDNRVLSIVPSSPSTLSDLTITDGGPGGLPGGGILTDSDLALSGVVLTGNRVDPEQNTNGGGLYANQDVAVLRSEVSGNTAYNGGGLFLQGDLLAEDSTISGNVGGSPTANGDGGGMQVNGMVVLRSTTITGNIAWNGLGAGAAMYATELTANNSIVAGNLAFDFADPNAPPVADNCSLSQLVSPADHSIEGTTDCGFTAPGNLRNTDPLLGPLASNGGPTDTHALLAGSPALDAGAGCGSADQRGVPRPQGPACDIGAFEAASCAGRPTTDVGSAGGDDLTGTPGGDVISLFGASDLANGLAGNDTICGDERRDQVSGEAGADLLFGGADNDNLKGGKGKDRLEGGRGKDGLVGGRGNDKLMGGKGKDKLVGGRGNDKLMGGKGKDRLVCGAGRDIAAAGKGDRVAASCELVT